MNKSKKSDSKKAKYLFSFKIIVIFHLIISFCTIFNKNKDYKYGFSIQQKMKDYLSKNFSIIQRLECPNCGFFSFYIVHLGCAYKSLSQGYIPIIDLQSFPNIYNNGNTSKDNIWEFFFFQTYNYTLEEVKKYAKNAKFLNCTSSFYRPRENIYYNNYSINFWHNFAKEYIPLRKEIIHEVNIIIKKLFGNSKNVLGVKIRGTDYTSRKKGHPIPPKVEQVISDVKILDEKYHYDFIFFSSEDEIIKKRFAPEFRDKLKLLNPNIYIKYDYKKNNVITLNENVKGNLDYLKNYVFNIIILSRCLDIVTARCSGAIGIFILTDGFRNSKIYNLGIYN